MNRGLEDRDLWDVLAVLCLGALVTWGWAPTYAGVSWWVGALVAALFALCVLLVVRDMAGNVVVAVGVMLLAYAVAAGPVAAGSLTVRGGDTFTDGLAATGEVWRRLLDTHPPVDGVAAFLLPPVITALVVVGLGAATALWTTRPAAPLVPVAAGLVTVLLMGRHEAGSAVLLGAAVAGASMLWVRLRAGRLDEERFGSDPVRTRGLVLTLVVLLAGSLAAAGVAGEPGTDRFVLRDTVRAYDVRPLRTPLDDFRDFTPQPPGSTDNVADERLLRVEGLDPGSRLRFAALDSYDGVRWRAANDTDPLRDDDDFLRVSSTIDNPGGAGEDFTVEISPTRHWDGPWVPTAGAVQSFDFGDDDSERGELRYNPATQSAVLPEGVGRTSYAFTTRRTDVLATPDLGASPAADRELAGRLGALDTVINAWDRDAFTVVGSLFNVMDELRRVGRFSHGTEPWERQFRAGHGLRRLTDDFLLADPTVGDQEQYAAAVALIAARRYIPVRVVVGAVVPHSGVVRGRDVTAWVEIRAADGSWRTIPTERFMSRKPPDRLGPPPDLRGFPPLPPSEAPQDPLSEDADDDEPGAESRPDDGTGGPARWLLLLGVSVVLVASIPPALKWRRRRRRLRAKRVSARYAGAWDELVDRARDLGEPVSPKATRPAQAATLDRARSLALRADSLIFSAAELDPGEADAFWRLVRTELRELDEGAPRWRRWWAAVNPRSLWDR